jgi:hypothetical protein
MQANFSLKSPKYRLKQKFHPIFWLFNHESHQRGGGLVILMSTTLTPNAMNLYL